MPVAAHSKLCSSVLAWLGVFASIAKHNIYTEENKMRLNLKLYICLFKLKGSQFAFQFLAMKNKFKKKNKKNKKKTMSTLNT